MGAPYAHRPRLKLEKETSDRYLEIAGVAVLICMIFYTAISLNALPDEIPRHFNEKGQPDGYGDKMMIWLIPGISLLLYVILYNLTKYPHIFNYAVPITKSNAKRQYRLATRMIRYLNVTLLGFMAYINYITIQIGLGNQDNLGAGFIVVFIVSILLPILYFTYSSIKAS